MQTILINQNFCIILLNSAYNDHPPPLSYLKFIIYSHPPPWFGYIVYYIDKGNIWKRSILNWGGSFHMKIMKFGLLGYFWVLNWFLGGAKLKKIFKIFKMASNPRWRPNGHHIEMYDILKMLLVEISLTLSSNRFRMQKSPYMPSFTNVIWKLPP